MPQRMANLDVHTPHLTAIALADPGSAKMHRATLKNADARLHAAIDLLLEVAKEMSPAGSELKATLSDYEKLTDKKAKDFLATEKGFGLVHRAAAGHIDSHLRKHGGSFLQMLGAVNPIVGLATGAFGGGFFDDMARGVSKGFNMATNLVGGVTGGLAHALGPMAMLMGGGLESNPEHAHGGGFNPLSFTPAGALMGLFGGGLDNSAGRISRAPGATGDGFPPFDFAKHIFGGGMGAPGATGDGLLDGLDNINRMAGMYGSFTKPLVNAAKKGIRGLAEKKLQEFL